MKTIIGYNPKEYKERNYALGLVDKIAKAKLFYNIQRKSFREHNVEVKDEEFEAASAIFEEYKVAKKAAAKQFAKGIKLIQANSRVGGFKVDFLYDKLKRKGFENLYLPEGWRDGKSIQNYSQNDFYSFIQYTIQGSKCLDGAAVIVTMLSKKKVWVLPADFQSQVNGFLEDAMMERDRITSLETLLDKMAKKTFTGEEWEQLFTDKKVFYITK